MSKKDVRAGRALLKGAVRAAETEVALAANVLVGVPGSVGGAAVGDSEGRLSVANTTSIAVGGADGTLAGHALVPIEALAFSRFSVADSLVGALGLWVSIVGSGCYSNPSLALWTSSEGTIMLGPGRLAVRAIIARALICGRHCERGIESSAVFREVLDCAPFFIFPVKDLEKQIKTKDEYTKNTPRYVRLLDLTVGAAATVTRAPVWAVSGY